MPAMIVYSFLGKKKFGNILIRKYCTKLNTKLELSSHHCNVFDYKVNCLFYDALIMKLL